MFFGNVVGKETWFLPPLYVSLVRKVISSTFHDFYQHLHHQYDAIGKDLQNQHLQNQYDTIGKDLWKQLKRVSIPIFGSNKNNYNWKAAFMACIDKAPATAKCKLLQLLHSAAAYQIAKERLERKFDG